MSAKRDLIAAVRGRIAAGSGSGQTQRGRSKLRRQKIVGSRGEYRSRPSPPNVRKLLKSIAAN